MGTDMAPDPSSLVVSILLDRGTHAGRYRWFETLNVAPNNQRVAYWPKTDMPSAVANVRFSGVKRT